MRPIVSCDHDIDAEVLRVISERKKVHREDFGRDVNHSRGVNGGWVCDEEIHLALRRLKYKGLIEAERDTPYRYWNWQLSSN